MVYVAFALTALAGIFIGVWLAIRVTASQAVAVNPARMWSFIEVLKRRTIESYAKELGTALELKYPDSATVSASMVVSFIAEYTSGVLEDQVTRR